MLGRIRLMKTTKHRVVCLCFQARQFLINLQFMKPSRLIGILPRRLCWLVSGELKKTMFLGALCLWHDTVDSLQDRTEEKKVPNQSIKLYGAKN